MNPLFQKGAQVLEDIWKYVIWKYVKTISNDFVLTDPTPFS